MLLTSLTLIKSLLFAFDLINDVKETIIVVSMSLVVLRTLKSNCLTSSQSAIKLMGIELEMVNLVLVLLRHNQVLLRVERWLVRLMATVSNT